MYRIMHDNFCYITTDQSVVSERIRQGYYVERIDYFRQELYTGKRIVTM